MTAQRPPSSEIHPTLQADLVVAGAGTVGLVLAIALAKTGFKVVCLGPMARERNGRTVALLDGSIRMLSALGIWPSLSALAAPLAVMRIVDDTPSLFRGPPLEFRAVEIGLPAFGYNVENADLVGALSAEASRVPGLTWIDSRLEATAARPDRIATRTSDGVTVEAQLLIAADGARSVARDAAGIGTHEESYPQTALTAILHHEEDHHETSTEFHTRQGPFTLVPLPATPGAAHRSSLVWVMSPAEAARRMTLERATLSAEIDTQSRFLLGRTQIEGTVGRFPIGRMIAKRLVGPRLALAGEAAHALPPIGAQGLNLSLRDAATLVDILAAARRAGLDPGSVGVLERYERARTGDIMLRTRGVDTLNKALLSSLLPVDAVRGAGMFALAALPSFRRALMRQGLMPRHAIPSLMQ